MQATLIYNRKAGGSDAIEVEEALDAMREAGYEPVYRLTRDERDLDSALEHADGLIVAAGGDGTLRAIITRLVGRSKPLAVIPMGTANNVGGALGLAGDPLALIRQLGDVHRVHYDLGRIQGPWGTRYFLEGAGFGLFADILHAYQPQQGKSILRGIEAFRDTVARDSVVTGRLWIDGAHYSNNYLLVEFLNTKAIGPRLQLAPNADPTDGFLDVVRIYKDAQEGFVTYMLNMVNGQLDGLETVDVTRAREISFVWTGFNIHIDAELWPPTAEGDAGTGDDRTGRPQQLPLSEEHRITVDVLPGAIELWLPRVQEDERVVGAGA